ncbi:MAG: sulfur carrier protein ThiS [Candidatus Sabulitectum sp.]|nr:sulfur carrier protein ThiS [Candidatus Sabulitectum sp.]
MIVRINGSPEEVRDRITAAELVTERGLNPEAVVIEVNRRIIERENWDETVLSVGDSVELVSFVGGG